MNSICYAALNVDNINIFYLYQFLKTDYYEQVEVIKYEFC